MRILLTLLVLIFTTYALRKESAFYSRRVTCCSWTIPAFLPAQTTTVGFVMLQAAQWYPLACLGCCCSSRDGFAVQFQYHHESTHTTHSIVYNSYTSVMQALSTASLLL
jgi:hypothetical protein